MIDLNDIKLLATHAGCPDGVASAILVKDALGIPVKFFTHNSKELAAFKPEPGILFCDFSPPAERAQEFVDAGAYVLDHHRTAKPVVELFGDRGVFADEQAEPGVCGAVLAYRHVWLPLMDKKPATCSASSVRFAENFARLAGIRDTYQRHSPDWDEACAQAEVLRFFPFSHWEKLIDGGGRADDSVFSNTAAWGLNLSLGPVLIQRHKNAVQRALEGAERITQGSHKFCVFQGGGLTTDAMEAVPEDVEAVIGFDYDSEKLRLSMRSRTNSSFDCAALAKQNNGGGHTHAAGCHVPIPSTSPFRFISDFIAKYVDSH